MVDKQDNPYPIGTRVRLAHPQGGYYSGTVVGCWWREGGTREGSHGWSYQVTTDEPKVIHGAENLAPLYDDESTVPATPAELGDAFRKQAVLAD